jgi:protein SCO1/2
MGLPKLGVARFPIQDSAGYQEISMKTKDRTDMFVSRRRLLLAGSLLALGGLAQARRALAADAKGGDKHDHHQHEHHQHAPVADGLKRTEAVYKVPGLTLVRQDGTKVEFPAQLDDGRPVFLDFIYTSCTAVCPVTSQIFSQLQEKLGKDREKVQMISISIDPEYDTPKRLAEYAKKFNAAAQWQHYTGTAQASIAIQKAFDAYRGDKMNHFPVTFMRAAPGKPWVRLEGFATPDVLVREYRDLVKGA